MFAPTKVTEQQQQASSKPMNDDYEAEAEADFAWKLISFLSSFTKRCLCLSD